VTAPATFHEASRLVAAKFLHSVVVVDDRAEYAFETTTPPGGNVTPAAPDLDEARPRGLRAPRRVITPPGAQRRAEDLNAKSMVDGFAEMGLVCAILRPAIGEEPNDKTVRAAGRSDIVILDWNIHGDDGDTTCELLSRILKSDEGGNRLRLIAIYTGERDIRSIAKTVREKLNEIVPKPRLKRDGQFAMTKGAVRIVIFAKADTKIRAGDTNGRDRIFTESALPDRLVAEFATLAEGLVANVALSSLAALRANTHRVLGQLRPSLDPAYLWHRAVQARPSDAEEHLVALVGAEIRSILDDEQVGKKADLDAIDLWLTRDATDNYADHFGETEARSRADVLELLKTGAAGLTEKSKAIGLKFKKMRRGKEPHLGTASLPVFAKTAAESIRSHEQFAALMSMKTQYVHPIPVLQLGTIVSRGRGKTRRYWLCVQPRCDSVRLTAHRSFPLLPLKVATEAKDRFGIVITSRAAKPVKLVVSKRPYDLTMVEFAPISVDNDSIMAEPFGAGYRFRSKDGWFTWVGDLKEDHAQRIADELAHQFGRVGLTESEWLMLSSGR
jgi:hypothetical protein